MRIYINKENSGYDSFNFSQWNWSTLYLVGVQRIHKEYKGIIQLYNFTKNTQRIHRFFSRESNSTITNVRYFVSLQKPSYSQKAKNQSFHFTIILITIHLYLSLFAIMAISHHNHHPPSASQKLCLSYSLQLPPPLCLAAIIPICHHAHHASEI